MQKLGFPSTEIPEVSKVISVEPWLEGQNDYGFPYFAYCQKFHLSMVSAFSVYSTELIPLHLSCRPPPHLLHT